MQERKLKHHKRSTMTYNDLTQWLQWQATMPTMPTMTYYNDYNDTLQWLQWPTMTSNDIALSSWVILSLHGACVKGWPLAWITGGSLPLHRSVFHCWGGARQCAITTISENKVTMISYNDYNDSPQWLQWQAAMTYNVNNDIQQWYHTILSSHGVHVEGWPLA